MKSSDMLIGYVCTNFNSSEHTVVAVESLRMQAGLSAHIVIVDNASAEADRDHLRDRLAGTANLDIVWNERNCGYFEGLNAGIHWIRERRPDILWIIVGNNDLEFPAEFGAQFSEMAQTVSQKYAVISPNILTQDGVRQNPHVIIGVGRVRELLYSIYYTNYFVAKVFLYISTRGPKFFKRRDEEKHAIEMEIFQGHGSCYILTPTFFALFTRLWAPVFVYFEEYFLARQVASGGSSILYYPGLLVRHMTHASLGKLPGKKAWQLGRDSFYVYRRFERVLGRRRPVPADMLPVSKKVD